MNRSLIILLLVILPLHGGCASSRYGHGWGEMATASPGWSKVGRAARAAAFDPGTWIPAAGAAVFGLSGLDENLSDWAAENTVISGSRDNAREASDNLVKATAACWAGTVILAPGGEKNDEMLPAKVRGLAVEAGAVAAAMGSTRLLKLTTQRERPDGQDRESFPSGHTSSAFVFSSMAGTNLEWFDMDGAIRKTLQIGLTAVAAGTGWARIEAGAHYPSDVLFGAALGNFMAVFFIEAFLGTGYVPPVSAGFVPTSHGAVLSFRMLF